MILLVHKNRTYSALRIIKISSELIEKFSKNLIKMESHEIIIQQVLFHKYDLVSMLARYHLNTFHQNALYDGLGNEGYIKQRKSR